MGGEGGCPFSFKRLREDRSHQELQCSCLRTLGTALILLGCSQGRLAYCETLLVSIFLLSNRLSLLLQQPQRFKQIVYNPRLPHLVHSEKFTPLQSCMPTSPLTSSRRKLMPVLSRRCSSYNPSLLSELCGPPAKTCHAQGPNLEQKRSQEGLLVLTLVVIDLTGICFFQVSESQNLCERPKAQP